MNIFSDQSNANSDVGNEIIYNIDILKFNPSDHKDAQILVRGQHRRCRTSCNSRAFKNCAPFTNCITKIVGTTIDDAEHLDLVMPMYNLLEYNSNYFDSTDSLWFYSKDEAKNINVDIW